MNELYDTIGINYSNLRCPDYRIEQLIGAAISDARTVLNVGAGAGSYEPNDKKVTALEPSIKMIRQRSPSNKTIIQGSAEHIPFDNLYFDASMAILTVHYWSDQQKGVSEMRRVTRDKLVFLTFYPAFREFWLTDYFLELITMNEDKMPKLKDFENWLGSIEVSPVQIPHDCTDGFLAVYWRRLTAYLDKRVRAAMSSFWALKDVSQGLERLEADIKNGT